VEEGSGREARGVRGFGREWGCVGRSGGLVRPVGNEKRCFLRRRNNQVFGDDSRETGLVV